VHESGFTAQPSPSNHARALKRGKRLMILSAVALLVHGLALSKLEWIWPQREKRVSQPERMQVRMVDIPATRTVTLLPPLSVGEASPSSKPKLGAVNVTKVAPKPKPRKPLRQTQMSNRVTQKQRCLWQQHPKRGYCRYQPAHHLQM
jgi:hypothetical protein